MISSLHTEVITNDHVFTSLKDEWEDLYHNAPLATPFQSWAWLYSWWESYGKGFGLHLVTVRDGDILVGIAPLMLEHRLGFGRLLFVGTGITDYSDVVLREGWEERAGEALRFALERMNSWHVVEFQELRPEAAAWTIFDSWPGPKGSMQQSTSPVISVRPWDELLGSLSKRLRSTARRSIRRAEEDGVVRKLANKQEAEQAARRSLRLHREMWQGREIAQEHVSASFEAHLSSAIPRMIACGLGEVSEFWRDGEVIVSDFRLLGHDSIGDYLGGASREALRRYQVSSLSIWDGVGLARERGKTRLDLLRGEEEYKLRWRPDIVPNHRVILGRNPIPWTTYVGYRRSRYAARSYLESGNAPRWVERALSPLRGS